MWAWREQLDLGECGNLELFLGATSTGINNKLALLSSLEATAQRSLPTPARSLSQAKRTKGYKPASQPALMLSFRLARSFLRLLARFFLFLSTGTLTMVHSSSSYNTLKLALVLARVFLCIFCGFLSTSLPSGVQAEFSRTERTGAQLKN